MYLDELIYFQIKVSTAQSAAALVSKMSRRCTARPGASARDLFIRDLFIGGNFEKDSATVGKL